VKKDPVRSTCGRDSETGLRHDHGWSIRSGSDSQQDRADGAFEPLRAEPSLIAARAV